MFAEKEDVKLLRMPLNLRFDFVHHPYRDYFLNIILIYGE